MSDTVAPGAIWYYAKNDEQLGPVTPAQLKALATSGKLLPADLIWKEGMEDWLPASEVKGLFAGVTPAPPKAPEPATPKAPDPAPPPPASPPVNASPAVSAPPAETVAAASVTPTPIPAAALAAPPGPSPVSATPAPGSRWANPPPEPTPAIAAAPRARLAARGSLGAAIRPLGYPLLFLGLCAVLVTRGCDSLGDRHVARRTAQAETASQRFDDTWEAKRLALQARRDKATASGDIDAFDQKLTELAEEQRKARQELEDDWRLLAVIARDAAANNQMWAYWRQLALIPAALVLLGGVIIVGSTGEGPDRWLALVLLGVMAYSLFVSSEMW